MSNNTPDYNDNLAFEPELNWEELVALMRDKIEQGYFETWFDVKIGEAIATFYSTGDVVIEGKVVKKKKTPAQMKTIIEALRG